MMATSFLQEGHPPVMEYSASESNLLFEVYLNSTTPPGAWYEERPSYLTTEPHFLPESHQPANFSLTDSSNFSSSHPDIAAKCLHLERYKNFRLVIDVFVVGTLILGGMLGNTLTILVMRADNMNSNVSFLLQALAVADNTYLVACLFMQTLKALTECSNWIPGLKYTYHHMEPYIWPLASTAQTITVWLVVLVTLDRYIAICHPFNTSKIFTLKRIKKAVLVIILLGVVYNIPRFFEHQTEERFELCQNMTILTTSHTSFRKNRFYFIIYKTCFYFLFRVVIPLGMLAILNTKLILALKGATQSHAVLTRTTPRSDSFTKILIVVVTVFMICEFPSFVLRLVVTVKHFAGPSGSVNYILAVWYSNTVVNMLLTLNSSINCLIYCVSGNRFRKIVKRLCCRMCMSGTGRQCLVVGDEPFLTKDNSMVNGDYQHQFIHRQSTMRTTVCSGKGSPTKNEMDVNMTCMKETTPLADESKL